MHNSVMLYMLELSEFDGLYISISRPKPHKKTVLRMFDGYGNTVSRKINMPSEYVEDTSSLDKVLFHLLSDMRQAMIVLQLKNYEAFEHEHDAKHILGPVTIRDCEDGLEATVKLRSPMQKKQKREKK